MVTLNHRVTLQQPAAGQDALGQPTQGFTTVADVWADVRHVNGLQAIKADARVSAVQASIRVWRRADLAAGWRVLHGGVVYAVRAVLLPERDFADLVCEVVS
jgi:SPP1 family predicted phage head-tail adaptor